jgi:hypothetical protein
MFHETSYHLILSQAGNLKDIRRHKIVWDAIPRHGRCYSSVTTPEMGNFPILDAVHQQHNVEVRDETYDQLNSYFIWHYRFSDHGLFPRDLDRHAVAAAGSARLG